MNSDELKNIIDKLEKENCLREDEWKKLFKNWENKALRDYAAERAVLLRIKHYGKTVFVRGLIEISNYCRNDCFYCGIRKSNKSAERYRLEKEDILDCCRKGYEIGFRTFVLQGGEDPYYTESKMTDIIEAIKSEFPDCALTLSIGEASFNTYKKYKMSGADRFLLRHETADKSHYEKLHPKVMSYENRMRCLKDLREIGFQTGCGIMVDSPFQTDENLVKDMIFMGNFKPHMIGIGPFIPHHSTPFKDYPKGSVEKTLFIISLLRIMLPNALIPATTALGTLDEKGREKGILAGANVIMPNLSPLNVRDKYLLYDNKLHSGNEAAESFLSLCDSMKEIGYEVAVCRGDFKI